MLLNPVTFGDLTGTVYDFAKGEGLPMHSHDESTIHLTFVVRGRIIARGEGWESTHTAGQLVDFQAGEPHEITAAEDDTRIVNLLKHPLKGA